jgi:PAS domain S-box-containing protein
LRLSLVLFVLTICLVGIAVLALDVARRIDEGATANSDAVQWTLSQTDVELLALDVAIHDALLPPEGELHPGDRLSEIRKRYDVFFSRVGTMGSGSLFAQLHADPQFERNYLRLVQFLKDCTPLLDGPDAGLLASLDLLHHKVTALRVPSRTMALAGLGVFARISQENRKAVERTLLIVAGLTVVFILTLLLLVVALMRLDRLNRARTAEVESGAARLAAIVATAQDPLITLDAAGRIVDYNAAAVRIFGHARVDVVGADAARLLVPPDQRVAWSAALNGAGEASASGPPTRHRLTARGRNGRLFPVELTVSATRVSDQARLRVVFLRDLTRETAAETALVMARDEALAGERAKADLLAVMSHEVRTPLNGLLGTLELLGETRLSVQQRDYLRILDTSGRLLLHHVNDVLDIARLDSGLMPMAPVVLELDVLARAVVENQAAAAAAQGNTLAAELPADPGRRRVVSDERLLTQVLLNLVGNAVKFTDHGTITLTIRHLGPEGPTEFAVSDTGVGIPEADLPRIFDDFVTLDASYARAQGGTGLGLGIARRIVAQLGGRLEVESRAGVGSTFRFALALPILSEDAVGAPAEAAPEGVAEGVALAEAAADNGLQILVVEDNAINRQVLGDRLTRSGHRVTAAADGRTALRLAGERRFDVVLMDISMPGMDGLQVTAALRAAPGPNRTTPVIAVTAHALPEDRARYRAGGVADVVTKPFTAAALDRALRTCLGLTSTTPTRRSRSDAAADGLARLVPAFLDEGARSLAEIGVLANGDWSDPAAEALQRAVHRLAGSAGLIGAAALARKLARIETALKTGDRAGAQAGLDSLPALWTRTVADLAPPADAAQTARSA